MCERVCGGRMTEAARMCVHVWRAGVRAAAELETEAKALRLELVLNPNP